jgi:hypothetical protein
VVAAGSEEKQNFWWGMLAHGVVSKAHTLTESCEDVQFVSRKLSAIRPREKNDDKMSSFAVG